MNIEEIVIDIQSGEINKFRIIMDHYYKEIFKYVYNLVGDNITTEDLVHEIFIKVYKNIQKYNPDKASFRTWLYRISSNHVINYFNSKSYRQIQKSVELDFDIKSNENILEGIIKKEKIDLIISIMHSCLKEKHLKIMNLHFFSGLSVNEISESLGIPQKTIYKVIKTSIVKIKKEVQLNGKI